MTADEMARGPWVGLWTVEPNGGGDIGFVHPFSTREEAERSALDFTNEPMNPKSSKPYRVVPWEPKPVTVAEAMEWHRVRCSRPTAIELRMLAMIQSLAAKAEGYERALRFYADLKNWRDGGLKNGTIIHTSIYKDDGAKAREALAGGAKG